MEMPAIDDPKRRGRILCGVAGNPSAPPDVVRRLLRIPRAAEQVARRRLDITDDLAEAIIDLGDADIATCLGSNDHVPTSVRWRLAEHPDPKVRASAARHAVADHVVPGREVPAALLEHLADDPDPTVRAKVAEHRDTPDRIRAGLAADPDAQVRKTLAKWWLQAPDPVRRKLLTDPDPEVRVAAITPWRPAPPPDLHQALLADPATRPAVIPYVALSPDLATELAGSPDEDVRQALATRPDLPEAVRERLGTDPDLLLRVRLVMNRTTPEETRTRLLAALDEREMPNRWFVGYFLGNAWLDRTSLGWLWEAPLPERLAYLDSPHHFLRRAVAASADLPRHAIDRLLDDPDIETRRIVARGHDVPAEVLERIVREHGEIRHVRPLLVDHPNFPRDAFARFATSDLARLRHLACHDRDLPPDLVARLAADTETHVRLAAAGHPNLPARCLPGLLTDDDLDVAEAAATAPAMPIAWMTSLLTAAGA